MGVHLHFVFVNVPVWIPSTVIDLDMAAVIIECASVSAFGY